jgi:ABC-type multidrug transport system ATPase subunit
MNLDFEFEDSESAPGDEPIQEIRSTVLVVPKAAELVDGLYTLSEEMTSFRLH